LDFHHLSRSKSPLIKDLLFKLLTTKPTQKNIINIDDTVDARNPAPPCMVETLYIIGYTTYQLVQDFFHPQYV